MTHVVEEEFGVWCRMNSKSNAMNLKQVCISGGGFGDCNKLNGSGVWNGYQTKYSGYVYRVRWLLEYAEIGEFGEYW